MKKIIATLFALMLVASIMPAAFAARGSGSLGIRTESSGDDSLKVESETEVEHDGSDDGIRTESRTEYRDGVLTTRDEFRNGTLRLREEFRSSNFSNLSVEDRKELLMSIKERRTELRENRISALAAIRAEIMNKTAHIKDLREQYNTEREQFMSARGKVKSECKDARSDDCREAKKELNNEAKNFMGNAAEQMLSIIDTMKTRVEANEHIDNETALVITAQLDARADAIKAAQAKIQNLSNSTDLNATQAAATELRSAWSEARVTIRLTEGLLVHARYAEFVASLEQMETRFTEARDQLASQGKNVTQLNTDLAAFSAQVDAAQTAYAQSQDSYLSAMATAKTEAQANELLKSTRQQLKENHESLQEARKDLRAVLADIRSLSTTALAETARKVQHDADATAGVETEVETGEDS